MLQDVVGNACFLMYFFSSKSKASWLKYTWKTWKIIRKKIAINYAIIQRWPEWICPCHTKPTSLSQQLTRTNISVLFPGSTEALSIQLGWVGLGFRLSWFKSDHLNVCLLMVLRLAPTRKNFSPMENRKSSRGWAGKPDASWGLQFIVELPLTLHWAKQVILELTWLEHHAHPTALHDTQQVRWGSTVTILKCFLPGLFMYTVHG